MKKIFLFAVGMACTVPTFTHAAFDGLKDLVTSLRGIVNIAIPLAFALALLFFFYGVAKFIFRLGGDTKAVEDGKKLMGWGLVALFVIASVWGIVEFAQRQFNITPNTTPPAFSGGNTTNP